MIINRLTAFERDAVKHFYLALSEDDRRMRFCATASDETVGKYVDRIQFTHATVLGAFDERAQLIGVAELIPGIEESDLAFAVRADRRGQKIGTKLMQKLLMHARWYGIRRVVVMFLSKNMPMRRLSIRAGMQVRTDGADCNAFRELEAPAAEEVARWAMEDWIPHGQYFGSLMIARCASSAREPVSATLPLATGPQITPGVA